MRFWWDDFYPAEMTSENALNAECLYLDSRIYLPFYLDTVELGTRVSDYLNGPAEEQLLEDLLAGRSL